MGSIVEQRRGRLTSSRAHSLRRAPEHPPRGELLKLPSLIDTRGVESAKSASADARGFGPFPVNGACASQLLVIQSELDQLSPPRLPLEDSTRGAKVQSGFATSQRV